jgi:hypothetical protein
LITGAADDDPSGISTYSVTGASFGYAPLWTALFSFPLMAAVQLMCARLGLVTGRGLAGVVRRNYARPVLWCACALLIVANVFNIGADLGGMAEATAMMTGIKSSYRLQRCQDALLLGSAQWGAGVAADRARSVVDEQSQGHGPARQSTATALARLGDGNDYGRCYGGDDLDLGRITKSVQSKVGLLKCPVVVWAHSSRMKLHTI